MWRAMFLAIGFFLILLGVQCLAVDTIHLKMRDKPPAPVTPWDTAPKEGALKQLRKGKAHLLGVVLNRLDVDKAERYYGYGRHFSYGGKYKYYKKYGYYGDKKT